MLCRIFHLERQFRLFSHETSSSNLSAPRSTLRSYLPSQHLRSDAGSRSFSVGLLWIPIWLVFFGWTLQYLLSHPLDKRRGESGSLLHLPSRSHFDISQPSPQNIPWAPGLNRPHNNTVLPCARLDHAGVTLRSDFVGPFLHAYFCSTTIISQKSHPLPQLLHIVFTPSPSAFGR